MGIIASIFGKKLPPDPVWPILERHTSPDHKIYPMAEHQSVVRQVEEVARELGVTFPPDYIAHLTGRFPGVYVEAKPEIWPRAKMFDVAPFWSFLYGVHTFTASRDSEPWMRLSHVGAEFQKDTGLKAAPILKVVGDADVYCVDADGVISRYAHETNELGPVEFTTFTALFDHEIQELRARTDRKKNGG